MCNTFSSGTVLVASTRRPKTSTCLVNTFDASLKSSGKVLDRVNEFPKPMDDRRSADVTRMILMKINGILITENTFRKELGLGPRLSHDAKFLHVEGTLDKVPGKSKEFWKKAFQKNKIKI